MVGRLPLINKKKKKKKRASNNSKYLGLIVYMHLQGWLLACLRNGQFIHGTMQIPQRHCCEGKQRVQAAPPSPILLCSNTPCSQIPFLLLLYSGYLLLLIQISFCYLMHCISQPSKMPNPEHS